MADLYFDFSYKYIATSLIAIGDFQHNYQQKQNQPKILVSQCSLKIEANAVNTL